MTSNQVIWHKDHFWGFLRKLGPKCLFLVHLFCIKKYPQQQVLVDFKTNCPKTRVDRYHSSYIKKLEDHVILHMNLYFVYNKL